MRKRLTVAVIVAAAVTASPALAQDDGAGLYEPFPGKARTKRAKSFVRELPRGAGDLRGSLELSGAQLDRGLIVRRSGVEPLRDPLPGRASARAGLGDGEPGPGPRPGVALAALLASLSALGLVAARR
jgi:hypothetical protein